MSLDGMQLGHYRLLTCIGKAANEVYLAQDLNIERKVAIKIMQRTIASFSTPDELKIAINQFVDEAKMISRLEQYPHILSLYEFGQETINGVLYAYLVMPYQAQGTLKDWLNDRTSNRASQLSPNELSDIISLAADALQYAHNQGVIHRDVKPTNFLIRDITRGANDPYPDLFLSDFGIAQLSSIDNNTRWAGTPQYMAPEQWNGHPVVASDQYALAVMAYQLLTGQLPFAGNPVELRNHHISTKPLPPSRLNSNINQKLDKVILCALEKDPTKRYPSVTEFARAFQRALLKDDFHQLLTISETEARKGSRKSVLLPGGRRITVTVPPHTRHGEVIALKGQGELNFDGSKSAVIVTIDIKPETVILPAISPPPTGKPMFAVLALFLVLSSTATIFYINLRKNEANSMMVKALTATSQAHAAATATVIRGATVAAQAHVTANAAAFQTAMTSQPIYQDILNARNNAGTIKAGWEGINGKDTHCFFEKDGYHVHADQIPPQACLESNIQYQDVTIAVDMTILTKNSSGGLLFRYQSDSKHGYFFEVSPGSRSYKISILNGDQLVPWTPSNAIRPGSNTLEVIANGQTLKFYINGLYLISKPDSRYPVGYIGIAAYGAGNNRDGEAVFSNLAVRYNV